MKAINPDVAKLTMYSSFFWLCTLDASWKVLSVQGVKCGLEYEKLSGLT